MGLIDDEIKKGFRKADNKEETCSICMCDLFDDELMTKSPAEIQAYAQEQLQGTKEIDQVILMGRCTDHCFHRACMEGMLKS
jgi:hypothetical protein